MPMPSFLLSKLKQAQPSMRRRLFLYMGALAVLLLAALFVARLLLGQLKSPRAETEKALSFQMGAFRSDMSSLWRNVSVMGIHLSEDMTAIIEEQTSDFSSLNGDVDAVGALQEAMLEPLCQYVRQTDCSGAFILLGASLSSDPAVDSKAGLYVQRGNAEHTTGDLLLYRGMADIGRRHKVMPHRKWAQEFDLSSFPGFAEHLEKASAPIERSCRTTEFITLPGTTEQAILLTVPMVGADGRVYGLCGFSVNQTYFLAHHTQPTRHWQPCLCSVGFCGGAGYPKGSADLSRGRLLLRTRRAARRKEPARRTECFRRDGAFLCRHFGAVHGGCRG